MERTRILFIHSGGYLTWRVRFHDKIRRIDSVECCMAFSCFATMYRQFASFQRLHIPFIPYRNRCNNFMPNIFHNGRICPFDRWNTRVKRRAILPARQQTALPVWSYFDDKMPSISQLDIRLHAEAPLPSGHFIAAHRPQSHFRQKFQNSRLLAISRFPNKFIGEILRRRGRLDPITARLGRPCPQPFAVQNDPKTCVAAGTEMDGFHRITTLDNLFELRDGESRPVRHIR